MTAANTSRFVLVVLLLMGLPPGPLKSERRPLESQRNEPAQSKQLSLRQAAESAGVLIGTAARPEHLSEPAYFGTLAREFNMVEAEDAMKWRTVHPGERSYDFDLADRVVRFAAEHRMKVRGHTLVWGKDNPAWLASGQYQPEQLSALLREHIRAVMGRYAGQVFAWDVVNEAFDESGKLRSSIWYDQPGIGKRNGTAYIEQSFRWAHEADPAALLFYNDAGGEGLNAKSDSIFAMVKDFRKRAVPIDGVGLQMHIENIQADIPSIIANISRLTALGLQVHITELDISIPVNLQGEPVHEDDLRRQAEIYRSIADACLSHPGCTAIQTWGFTDKYSWIGSHSQHTRGAALLFDRNYRPKPAYEALRETLGKRTRVGSR